MPSVKSGQTAQQMYSDDELLDQLREAAQHVAGELTKRKLLQLDEVPDATTFERRFGSWNQAKTAAGLDTQARGEGRRGDDAASAYSDDDLLTMLRDAAQEVSGPLTQPAFIKLEGYPDVSTYERRFRSWNQAKEQAGLATMDRGKGTRGHSYTDDDLLTLLRELAAEVDGPVRKADVAAVDEYPSPSTFGRRFDSWTNAKHKAGIE